MMQAELVQTTPEPAAALREPGQMAGRSTALAKALCIALLL